MRTFLCLLCGVSFLATGCGGGSGGGPAVTPAERSKLALEEVGELYRVYTVSFNKAPGRFEDLKSVGEVGPTALKAIKAGEIVVLYEVTMTDTTEGKSLATSDEVLAYEKHVPEAGGGVLLLDRTVRTMTADEFKAAKKAGKG